MGDRLAGSHRASTVISVADQPILAVLNLGAVFVSS